MEKRTRKQDHKPARFVLTVFIAVFGGLTFSLLGTPIPWLLGPMTSLLICARFINIQLYWPVSVRNIGLIMVGYSIGLSFTKNALIQILGKLPSMFIMTFSLILFCAAIAFVISKLTKVDYPTVLTGSIPGGLSQMIIFAEEMKGIDITTVTFLQVARLLMIIFFVPFLTFGSFFNNRTISSGTSLTQQTIQTGSSLFPNLFLFALISVLCAFAGKKLKFPTPYLLGPILGTAVMSISGLHGPALPSVVLNLSQFFIGGYIGLLLKPEKLEQKAKIISLALLSGLFMIAFSLGLSLVLVHQNHLSNSTSLLSLSPGGMDQMGILAQEAHADLSMVTGYQLFRLFFIYFAVPPTLKWLFKLGHKQIRETS